jgi:hypothetical protein
MTLKKRKGFSLWWHDELRRLVLIVLVGLVIVWLLW